MQYKPPETKWQKTWRLLKKWHPFWLPPAIIFFDRLFIMWPYIPIGEATFYMKAQAIETFDWSIFWVIHVAETLFLLFLWIWLVCFHIALCAFWIRVVNRVWQEDKYQRALEKSVVFKIHCAVAAEQVHKYLRRIYKETKQDKFLLDNWPFGQFAVQALPRREFRAEAKSLPSHVIPNDLAATPADFADYMSAFKYVLQRVRATFETEVLPARRQGKVVEVQPAREGGGSSGQTFSGARGAGEPSAGPSGPEMLEPEPDGAESVGGAIQEAAADMAPPSQESRVEKEPSDEAGQSRHEESATNPAVSEKAQPALPEQEGEGKGGAPDQSAAVDEAAAPSSAEARPSPPAPAAPIKGISLKEAEAELSRTIARRNQQRLLVDLPSLAATDIAKIRQEIFSRVDPAELEASCEGQSSTPGPAPGADGGEQSSSVDMPEAREPQPIRCEESCLVRRVGDGQEDEELDDDDEEYENEQVSSERWEKVLKLAGGDSLVAAVLLVMSNRNEWRGSPSELLATLNLYASQEVKAGNDWPQNVRWLTRQLNQSLFRMSQVGLKIDQARTKQSRIMSIHKSCAILVGDNKG